jgi:hypothetical protein
MRIGSAGRDRQSLLIAMGRLLLRIWVLDEVSTQQQICQDIFD